ncbi:hypothetical protein EUREKA_7 [Mycobacterium phage Eureka]|uniref:Uncharacterized protein n=2 Tax=Kostyavirus eureka TaxID=1074306 RepID=G1JWM7_9CAUD|nr:hypothetical protein GOKU_8 [Mycobacterium phage Goku]YP_009591547.1 hypothetical protein FDG60_gp007 [Mycobacterium phage Eureka]AEL98025.1 hypothetical protein EUREKA_7 [Mycobacterium phage Eureka]AGT14117.1 hypothetical protein GOKU_8 [Mycobacterium phage Goku]AYQ99693.1 hypothetical protein PBI_MANDA_7 [Mycobacterium phage Manda]
MGFMIETPREMIKQNAPGAVGITNVVLWVRLTKHQNPYISDPRPYGLLKITEVGLDGQIIKAVFSEGGTSAFVSLNDPGFRNTAFEYAGGL